MPNIATDLSVNINNTIYLTIVHNYIPILFALGFLISVFWSIKKPSRSHTFILLGFILLLFEFEYSKHIIEGLKTQTINSVITANPHYTAKKWLNIIIEDLTPMFLFISGWFFLLLGYLTKQPDSKSSLAHKPLSK
jgi:hypothetical protein